MRKFLVLMALVLSVAAPSGSSFAGSFQRITGEELVTMLKDGAPTVIVDVREPELYSAGHIPGAINIPYDSAHGRILKELKPSDRIVFVCHGGPMGDELGEILARNGYSKVYNVTGGMKKWKGAIEK